MADKQFYIDAINNLDILEIHYRGDTGVMERRLIEPHLIGEKTTGKLTLSAWQTYGDDGGTGWRNYTAHKIVSPQRNGDKFGGPRGGYNPNDKTMVRIWGRI